MKRILTDVLALAGTGLVSYGTYLLKPEAGLIVCGSLLLVAATAAGYQESRKGKAAPE